MDEELEAVEEINKINVGEIVKETTEGTQTPSETTPPVGEVQGTQKPTEKPNETQDQENNIDQQLKSQRASLLNEIFGDRFKSVEEAKEANIPSMFSEIDSLRETSKTLEEKLSKKPKTQFVNDKLALFNEFVKETGVDNYGVFNRISGDVESLDSMQSLVAKFMMEHPEQAGKEDMIKRSIERKYGIRQLTEEEIEDNPSIVQDMEDNKFQMDADGADAKKSLMEVKAKLKLPEPEEEVTPEAKAWTPEEKANNEKNWLNIGQKVSEGLSKLAIPIKGNDDSFLSYELSEDETKEITEFVTKQAVENQMELNEANVKLLSNIAYNQTVVSKLPNIVHSVFEKARNMTDEEVRAKYENPSARSNVNNDTPPAPNTPQKTSIEEASQQAIDLELG